jgi:hypothetical protein
MMLYNTRPMRIYNTGKMMNPNLSIAPLSREARNE